MEACACAHQIKTNNCHKRSGFPLYGSAKRFRVDADHLKFRCQQCRKYVQGRTQASQKRFILKSRIGWVSDVPHFERRSFVDRSQLCGGKIAANKTHSHYLAQCPRTLRSPHQLRTPVSENSLNLIRIFLRDEFVETCGDLAQDCFYSSF